MCLTSVKCQNLNQSGIGYKVFQKRRFELYSIFRGKIGLSFSFNKWLHKDNYAEDYFGNFESRDKLCAETGCQTYPAGFHIFLNKNDAKYYCRRALLSRAGKRMRKVHFRSGHTIGIQDIGLWPTQRMKVIVANEVFIPGHKWMLLF